MTGNHGFAALLRDRGREMVQIAGLLGLMLVLAACPGSKDSGSAGGSDQGAQSAGGDGAPTTIVLWEQDADIKDVFAEVIAAFEKKHPEFKVKTANYGTEDLRTQYQTAAIAGAGPDMVWAPNDLGGPFSIAGIIQPVGDWLDKDKFTEVAVAAVTDAKGAIWGVPVSTGNHLMLMSNKSLVPNPPTTLDELIEVAKGLSDPAQNKYGFAYNLNEPFWFVTFFSGMGGRVLDGNTPSLNNESMQQALTMAKSLRFDHKVVPPDCDYDCADTLFKEKKVGMVINGDWSLQPYADTLGEDLVVSALPRVSASGDYMAPMVSGKFLFINQQTSGKKLEGARALANFFTSPEIQELLIQKTRRLPSLKEKFKSEAVTGDKLLSSAADALMHGQPMPMQIELRAIWDAMRPQLQETMAGRVEPAAAADAMQKSAQAKISEMR